jgi:5-methylcytosine-specific restriction endonuclease McrA
MTGYTSSQLRTHLSEQMPDGKTWADVVSCQLHIEHIMPAAAFDLTTTGSIRRCYALSNLTLLCANKNASKGATTDKATVRHFRADPELARLFGLVE